MLLQQEPHAFLSSTLLLPASHPILFFPDIQNYSCIDTERTQGLVVQSTYFLLLFPFWKDLLSFGGFKRVVSHLVFSFFQRTPQHRVGGEQQR
jgi:hypothetical protein